MSFRVRILVALLAVGTVPAALVGVAIYTATRDEVTALVGTLQGRHADELARHCEAVIGHALGGLRLAAGYIPFDQLSPAEIGAVLALPQRQYPSFAVLALLDAEGRPLAPPLSSSAEGDAARAIAHAPVAEALAHDAAVGAPYRSSSGVPRVVAAVRIEGKPQRLLMAEVDLGDVAARLAEGSRDGALALLVDGGGQLVADGGGVTEPELTLARDAASRRGVRSLRRGDGTVFLTAASALPTLGWSVVVAQSSSVALHAATRIRDWSLGWVLLALVLSITVGLHLAHGLERPVGELSRAAEALTRGEYERRVELAGPIELVRFAGAFNHMAEEVRRRDLEIREWSAELQMRVDDRSRELKAAQDQVLRSRRLASLASLGAGIAHELNNPLTAILGLVTLLRHELGKQPAHAKTLEAVVEQTKRLARIVADLRQFADAERAAAGATFRLREPVESALRGESAALTQRGIAVITELPQGLPDVQGNPAQIEQVIGHLIRNAAHAMAQGGELRVGATSLDGDAVRLTVSDNGRGIPAQLRDRIFDPFFTTKQVPGQTGLGLAVCHGIVTAHHGQITVESVEGRGTSVHVLLPVVPRAHLR